MARDDKLTSWASLSSKMAFDTFIQVGATFRRLFRLIKVGAFPAQRTVNTHTVNFHVSFIGLAACNSGIDIRCQTLSNHPQACDRRLPFAMAEDA